MLGVIDAGGGMRAVYGAGVFDCFLDNDIEFEYCLGVSAGSANVASYLAKQRNRNFRFFTQYAGRKEYMSFSNYIRNGSYFNLDYIYSTLTDAGGEDPIDYDTLINTKSIMKVAATNASTGRVHYFTNKDVHKNDCGILKTSCAIPIICKPVERNAVRYYDGGVAEPIPLKKAYEDGCDRVVVILSKPINDEKLPERNPKLYSLILKNYPNVVLQLKSRHEKYNETVKELLKLEKEGKAFILAPDDCCGVNVLTKDTDSLKNLYDKGVRDAGRLIEKI